jgi:hypothetical protein
MLMMMIMMMMMIMLMSLNKDWGRHKAWLKKLALSNPVRYRRRLEEQAARFGCIMKRWVLPEMHRQSVNCVKEMVLMPWLNATKAQHGTYGPI